MAVTFWLKLQPLLYLWNIFIKERQYNVLMHKVSEVPAKLKMIMCKSLYFSHNNSCYSSDTIVEAKGSETITAKMKST